MRKLCSFSVICALGVVMVGILPASALAREVVVTDANNGQEVTLQRGDTLVVRLASNPTTAYSWHTVLSPTSIVSLSRARYIPGPCPAGNVGCGGIDEFRFVPSARALGATFQMGEWLRMLSLRPFDPGVEGAQLWQVDVTFNPE